VSRYAAITRASTSARAAALTATLGLAAASWIVASRQMSGMDIGVATRLGSFAFFVGLWPSGPDSAAENEELVAPSTTNLTR
jgi:ABC-type sugar transport system substrate-binding protein